MKPLRKHLKLIALLTLTLILAFGCSKDDEYLSRCFVVKDKNTNTPISGASISLLGIDEVYPLGHTTKTIGNGTTNQNGESCIIRGGNEIESIYCSKEGYKSFYIFRPRLGFKEIYLEPN